MSTRSTIYHHERDGTTPYIHIYREMLDEPPLDVRMEIDTEFTLVNIPLPVDLQELMGIPSVKSAR
jgi:hypothetical protein